MRYSDMLCRASNGKCCVFFCNICELVRDIQDIHLGDRNLTSKVPKHTAQGGEKCKNATAHCIITKAVWSTGLSGTINTFHQAGATYRPSCKPCKGIWSTVGWWQDEPKKRRRRVRGREKDKRGVRGGGGWVREREGGLDKGKRMREHTWIKKGMSERNRRTGTKTTTLCLIFFHRIWIVGKGSSVHSIPGGVIFKSDGGLFYSRASRG